MAFEVFFSSQSISKYIYCYKLQKQLRLVTDPLKLKNRFVQKGQFSEYYNSAWMINFRPFQLDDLLDMDEECLNTPEKIKFIAEAIASCK